MDDDCDKDIEDGDVGSADGLVLNSQVFVKHYIHIARSCTCSL
jgi:hypothetical protein